MTTLYLLRHGQSEWNILHKVQGQEDTVLTEKGVKQAQMAAERLKDEGIDIIYSSDLKRAYNTAEIVGNELGINVNKLESIREVHFGVWQGLDLDTIKRDYSDDYKLWRTEPHNLNIKDAENLHTLKERVLKDVQTLVSENPGKKILLVSHGAAIKALILGILDIDMSKYNKLTIGNVGLSIIEFREFSPVIKVLNDTSHVKEDLVW